MVDHEEWRLGDDPGGAVCPVCGKANRAGQVHCAFCGTPLDAESGSDPLALREIGEAMTGGRPVRRRRERPWMWPTAVAVVIAATVAGYARLQWWSSWPDHVSDALPHGVAATPATVAATAAPHLETKAEPPPAAVQPPPAVAPRPVATVPRVVAPRPAATAPAPAARPPVTAAIPPPAPAVRATPAHVAAPARTAAPRRVVRPRRPAPPREEEPEERAAVPPEPAVEQTPVAPRADTESVATPGVETRPSEDRPALGTDLVEAQRAYRTAIERYNARADEYNDIADQVQRGDGDADPDRAAALQAKLEHARAAAERAKSDADTLKAHLDAVQAKYR
jgi:hypothetical protein